MSRSDEGEQRPLASMTALGEALRSAAHRRYPPARRKSARPRRRHRLVLALVLILLAAVGAATAAELISVGGPAQDNRGVPRKFAPSESDATVSVVAGDPDRKLPWAVQIYRSKDGHDCVRLGQLRLEQLGEVRGGVFHPFGPERPGICGRLDRSPLVFSQTYSVDQPDRTLVYGRARAGISRLRIAEPESTHLIKTGPGGGFLAVFDGRIPRGRVDVLPAQQGP